MSTLTDVLAYARTQAQTDSNGLSNTDGIVYANEALFDFRRKLVHAGVDALGIQEAYRDASVPSAGNGSTFLYPSDFMFLKTIEVNFTDITAQNYIRAEQVDHANIPGETSFSWLRQNGNTQAPKFADNGDWYEIFPAFKSGNNLSQAIRLIYYQKPTEYTAVGDTISYPESLDYRILGFRIAANFCRTLRDFDGALAFDTEYEKKVKDFITTLSRGSQQPIQATTIPWTGWNF